MKHCRHSTAQCTSHGLRSLVVVESSGKILSSCVGFISLYVMLPCMAKYKSSVGKFSCSDNYTTLTHLYRLVQTCIQHLPNSIQALNPTRSLNDNTPSNPPSQDSIPRAESESAGFVLGPQQSGFLPLIASLFPVGRTKPWRINLFSRRPKQPIATPNHPSRRRSQILSSGF